MPIGFKFLNSENLVNTHTANNQYHPVVTKLDGGGHVIIWASQNQDGSGEGVYGQRYNAAGNPIGAEFLVNSTTQNSQFDPSVSHLLGGGFVVTWTSPEQSGNGSDEVLGQRYDASGAAIGAEFRVNSYTSDYQEASSVTTLTNGRFVVTWTSQAQDGSETGIYAQRFHAGGNKAGAEFRVNSTTADNQERSAITALADGGFLVTWQSEGQAGAGFSIFAQRYAANGTTVGTEFQINTHTTNDQTDPVIAELANGDFVVTWTSNFQDGSYGGVYAQILDAAGTPIDGEFRVNTVTQDPQEYAAITTLADGGFVIVWQSYGVDGPNFGIFGQRYNSAGEKVGNNVQINSLADDHQTRPDVMSFDDGSFIVTWQSKNQDGAGYSVYSQKFAAQIYGTSGDNITTDLVGAGWMNGLDGNDVLRGLAGKDMMFGGNNDDVLFGGTGNDTLKGGNGVDTLKGGSGKDELDGGKGKDLLIGGKGQDSFVFKDGYSKDRIKGFQDDVDTIHLDINLWGAGLTKQQVINTYASVDGGDIVFDFGSDELRLKGFTDLSELKDDMVFI